MCSAIVCATLAVARSGMADYSNTVMSFNPVMYYRLNEATFVPSDVATNLGSLGATATGIYTDGASHPTTGALVASTDTAALFPDAAGNRVRIPYHPSLAVRSAPYTVEFWANPTALSSTDSSTMCPVAFAQFGDPPGNGSSRSGWLFYQNGSTGWTFRTYGDGSAGYNATVSQTVTAGQWYHIVGVWDGSTAILYVNGQQAATIAAPTFSPVTNGIIPMTIGARADGQLGYFRYNGSVDEVAYYNSALSASVILSHYQNGTSASPATPYNQLVQASAPLAYYRLNEPGYADPGVYPVAANNGSLSTAADATYNLGVVASVPGVPYAGFGANNLAARFNGFSGNISIPPQSISADNLTITCWVKRWGQQNLGALLFQRDGSGNLATGLQIWDENANDLHGNWNGNDWGLSTGLVPPNDVWVFAAMVATPTNTVLYLGNQSVSLAALNGAPLSHSAHDFSINNLLIGQDPCCSPSRVVNGEIDEIAVFDTALSTADLDTIAGAAQAPPYIYKQPAAAASYAAGSPVSIAPIVFGSPALSYQWLKSGSPLSGQTGSALTFGNITTNDAGSYSVIITNAYGAVTSSVATFAVTYTPAVLTRAVGYPVYDTNTATATLTQVILEFTQPLGAGAADPAKYSGLGVTAAQFANGNKTIVLTTTAQTQGASYTITATGVPDGGQVPIVSPNNTASFRAWVASAANGVRFDYYPGNGNQTVADLTNDLYYPNSPSWSTNLWIFDSRAVFPDNSWAAYGARMRTYFTPDRTGNWRFYVRSDDDGAVFINPAGIDESGLVQILYAPSCCADWSAHVSDPIPLVAGQSYLVQLLYKEGGGGDFGKVAARLDGSAAPATPDDDLALDLSSMSGPAIGYPYAPADVGGALTLLGPSSLSIEENHNATFTVQASNPSGLPILYQWRRNGVPIDGATSSTYSFRAVLSDSTAQFTCLVSKFGSAVVSSTATLTVVTDTHAPLVVAVRGSTTLSNVIVSFSEPMSSPQDPSWFTINGIAATSATVDSTGTNVVLTFGGLNAGQTYNLSIANATDLTGHPVVTGTQSLRTFFFSRGLLQYDYFAHLSPSDNAISQLTSDPRYPNFPDATYWLTAFNSRTLFPDDSHDAYGAHVTGLFVPPSSGNYIFYLRSDDSSQMNLNPAGSDPAGSVFQIEETSCCESFSAHSNAAPVTLAASQWYFIEAMQKEGNGGDYVQVAAQTDTDTTPANALSPINPSQIGVLADPVGASVTITQQPASLVAVWQGASDPITIYNQDFNSASGGPQRVDHRHAEDQ